MINLTVDFGHKDCGGIKTPIIKIKRNKSTLTYFNQESAKNAFCRILDLYYEPEELYVMEFIKEDQWRGLTKRRN